MSTEPIDHSSDKSVLLRVETTDPQSEIFLLDGKSRFIDRAIGPTHTFPVRRGIYVVKVRTGTEYQEQTAVVLDDHPKPVRFERLAFASPAPLRKTATSEREHAAAAAACSRATHVRAGQGSSLFFFVRDWTPKHEGRGQPLTAPLTAGLALHETRGGSTERIADLATTPAHGSNGDPWAGCTVSVDPGVYELRLALPAEEVLHQTLVASLGWQTQVFLLTRAYPVAARSTNETVGVERRADLARASILLSHGQGFSDDAKHLRLAELARQALVTKQFKSADDLQRQVLPSEMREMLRRKLDDPMLGIYAAHLLLLERSPDLDLLREVIGNLRRLVGEDHPDVNALALRVEPERATTRIRHPPMLRRSWSLVVEATFDNPDLIAAEVTSGPSPTLWPEGPWHIWQTVASGAQGEEDENGMSALELAVAENVGVMRQVRRSNREKEHSRSQGVESVSRALGMAERGSVVDDSRKRDDQTADVGGAAASASIKRGAGPPAARSYQMPQLDLRSIARQFGIPKAQLDRVLSSMDAKVKRLLDAAGGSE